MREIKFRGKRLDSGKWIEGSLITSYRTDKTRRAFIVSAHCGGMAGDAARHGVSPIEVDSSTVGQFTGLQDGRGRDIFDGDIIIYQAHKITKLDKAEGEDYGLLTLAQLQTIFPEKFNTYAIDWLYQEATFTMYEILDKGLTTFNYCIGDTRGCEIIGNIHDNLELLKTERQ